VSQETRYYRVGLFVFVGIALLVGAVLLLGGGTAFKTTVVLETFFDESVEGLDVGSPVKMRGVKIGSVKEILLARDAYRMPDGSRLADDRGIDVVVRIEVTPTPNSVVMSEDPKALLATWIGKGFRLRLTSAGITGVVYLEGDFWPPDKYPAEFPPWEPAYPYIPAAPSAIKAFATAAERVLERVDKVDVEGVLTRLNTLLATMNDAAGKVDIEAIQERMLALLDDLQAVSKEVRAELQQVDTGKVSTALTDTLDRLSVTLQDLQQLLQSQSGQVGGTLDNVRVMSENLRDLSETLRSYPSLLLLGEPPAKHPEGKR
jgi:phospholipid/cholesterol/gamma-HCH transport system substrate-binding protein/paraquat-inducible protein B